MTKQKLNGSNSLTNEQCVEQKLYKVLDSFNDFERIEGAMAGISEDMKPSTYKLVKLQNGNGAVLKETLLSLLGFPKEVDPIQVEMFFEKEEFDEATELFSSNKLSCDLRLFESLFRAFINDLKDYTELPFPQNEEQFLTDKNFYEEKIEEVNLEHFLFTFLKRFDENQFQNTKVQEKVYYLFELYYRVQSRLKKLSPLVLKSNSETQGFTKKSIEKGSKTGSHFTNEECLNEGYFRVISCFEMGSLSDKDKDVFELIELLNGNWAIQQLQHSLKGTKKIDFQYYESMNEITKAKLDFQEAKVIGTELKINKKKDKK